MMPQYAVLAARIRQELQQLERIVSRVENVAQVAQAAQVSPDSETLVESMALNLQSFYTGAERIFQVIASSIDESLPASSDWHRQLLQQMTLEVNATRPAVLSRSVAQSLDTYLRFRHVVRSLYAFELDPERIRDLALGLRSSFDELRNNLDKFAAFLDDLAVDV